MDEYASSVTSSISKCMDDVTSTRIIIIHPNQKPWMNAEVRTLFRARDSAFRSDDAAVLRAARRKLTAGVKKAKAAYAEKIQGHFFLPTTMWAGIKAITDYNSRDTECPRNPSLPDALNSIKGIDFSIDPHQYAYKRNRCTADAIAYVVHMALTHLENRDSYVRLLFLDFSSAFTTIIPQTLVHKLEALGLSPA